MERFGWSWDYLHYEVSWPAVCRMLADGPRYDTQEGDADGTEVEVTFLVRLRDAETVERTLFQQTSGQWEALTVEEMYAPWREETPG